MYDVNILACIQGCFPSNNKLTQSAVLLLGLLRIDSGSGNKNPYENTQARCMLTFNLFL